MNATILGPNSVKLPLRLLNQNQIYSLTFTPMQEGEHTIQLTWDNHPLPNTPIVAKTTSASTTTTTTTTQQTNATLTGANPTTTIDWSKLEVNGFGVHEAKINTEAEFVVDGSRCLVEASPAAPPEIKLTGTRCDVDVRVIQIGHNVFRCVYVPQIPGAYLLNIKWHDRQVGDSPYKVNIGMNSDPSKVPTHTPKPIHHTNKSLSSFL